MSSVRKLAAVVACTALLSVFGATTAGAEGPARCERLAKLTERVEHKMARVAARVAKNPRAANASQKHKIDFQTKLNGLAQRAADFQSNCSD
jgi:hypothetical protein